MLLQRARDLTREMACNTERGEIDDEPSSIKSLPIGHVVRFALESLLGLMLCIGAATALSILNLAGISGP